MLEKALPHALFYSILFGDSLKRDFECEEEVVRAIPIAVRSYALGKAKAAARRRFERVVSGTFRLSRSSIYGFDVGGMIVIARVRHMYRLYVSEIVGYTVMNKIPKATVGERELRVLYRGLVYHSIVEKMINHSSYLTELPMWMPIYVGDQIYELWGTPDIVMFTSGGDAVVVELKSSDREETVIAGMLQAMIYSRILDENLVGSRCSCIATPSKTICTRRKLGLDIIEHMASSFLETLRGCSVFDG